MPTYKELPEVEAFILVDVVEEGKEGDYSGCYGS